MGHRSGLAIALLACAAVTAPGRGQSLQVQELGEVARPIPSPSLGAHPSLTSTLTVAIPGSVENGLGVRVAAPGTVLPTRYAGSSFAASVVLVPNSVNAISLTAVTDGGEASVPVVTTVTHDDRGPDLFVDFPADLSEVLVDTIDVGGRVDDATGVFGPDGLSGTRDDVTVDVNGVRASLSIGPGGTGTFLAAGIPLTVTSPATPTPITVTATDVLGNSTQREITVTRAEQPPSTPAIAPGAGSGQTGVVNQELAAPIEVFLTRADGVTPFEDKLVTFTVTRSDGLLSATPGGEGTQFLQVFTEKASDPGSPVPGRARAWWTLGSDAGSGNNRVRATSQDAAGTAVFVASATPGPATTIHVGEGNYQVAEAGASAPVPLRVRVDDTVNGVQGVDVTFTVLQGGGLVDGLAQTIVATDATGSARVDFTLGPSGGVQLVEADFASNLGLPVTFQTFGVVGGAGPATFRGLLLDQAERPIQGAACSLLQGGVLLGTATSDANGEFVLDALPDAGPAVLVVDGTVATGLDGVPVPLGTFPLQEYDTLVLGGVINSVVGPLSLPRVSRPPETVFDNAEFFTAAAGGAPGFQVTVGGGSMRLGTGEIPSPAAPVTLLLDLVDFDGLPRILPDGAFAPFAWSLQTTGLNFTPALEPSGAFFDPPASVQLPNVTGAAPGSVVQLNALDLVTNRFIGAGTARVTADGSLIVTDPGAGLSQTGVSSFGPPYPATTTVVGTTDNPPGSWAPSPDYFVSFVRLGHLLATSCDDLIDGTPGGYAAYLQCVGNARDAAGQVVQNAPNVPGTVSGGPAGDLVGATERAKDRLKEVLDETFGSGSTGPAGGSTAIVGTPLVLDVPAQVPAKLVEWVADVTFANAPAQAPAVGDAVRVDDLEDLGFGSSSTMTLVVTQDQPTLVVACRLVSTDSPPRGIASVGNQFSPVRPDGSFAVLNVPATPNEPLRPLVVYEGTGTPGDDGVDVHLVAAPTSHLAPVVGGTTDFGAVPLDVPVLTVDSLAASPPSSTLVAAGATEQLTATATLADGSQLDVTPASAGTFYRSSNPDIATVGPNGLVTAVAAGAAFVTVTNEGNATIVPVTVDLGDPLTTVVGFVTLADGTPVDDATVTVVPGNLTGSTGTGQGGRFTIADVPAEEGVLTVFVDADVGGVKTATVTDIEPVPGAFTDAGVIAVNDAFTWDGSSDGDGDGTSWSDPLNWSTDTLPQPGADVVIDDAGSPTVVLSGITADVRSLRCQENLTISSTGVLSVALPFQVNGSFTIAGEVGNCTIVAGSGSIQVSAGTGRLDSVELRTLLGMPSGTGLDVTGGLVLNGAIEMTNNSGSTTLRFAGNQSLTGSGTISMIGASGGNRLRPDAPSDQLTIESGITITGQGILGEAGSAGFVNQGTIEATGTGITLRGVGWVNEGSITAQPGSLVQAQDSWTNSAAGTMSADGGTLRLEGAWSNAGMVSAVNGATVILDGAFTPADVGAGVFSTSGSTVRIDGTFDLGGSTWTLDATTGSWGIRGGRVRNGTLASADGEKLVAQGGGGTSVLESVVLTGDAELQSGASVEAEGSLVLDGTVEMANGSGTTTLRFAGNQTLTGSGTISMVGPSGGSVVRSATDLDQLTIGPGITITGRGRVGSATATGFVNQGAIEATGTGITLRGVGWVNEGSITAQPGSLVQAQDSWTNPAAGTMSADGATLRLEGTWSNTGTISAVNGATVILDGAFTPADVGAGVFSTSGSTVRIDGTFDLGGSTWTLDATTGSWGIRGGRVRNGTLASADGEKLVAQAGGGTSVLESVVLTGDAELQSGASVEAEGSLVLDGTVEMANGSGTTTLRFAGNQTLTGSGTISMVGPSGGSVVRPATDPDQLTIGPGITITGRGRVGSATATGFVNQGTIEATGTGITLTGVGWANDGAITATSGSSIVAQGTWSTFGTVVVEAGGSFSSTTGFLQTGSSSLTTVDGMLSTASGFDLQDGDLEGAGTITGSLQSAGTVRPGGAGTSATLTVTGTYTQLSGGTLDVDLEASTNDALSVGGTATLDGGLDAAAIGFTPAVSDSFTILDASSVSGCFSPTSTMLPSLPMGTWDVDCAASTATEVVLEVLP